MEFPVILPAIVVNSRNRTLRVVYGGVGYTCQIAPGTYYLSGSGASLLAAIGAAFTAVITGAPVFTMSVARNVTYSSQGTVVTMSAASAWYVDVESVITTFDWSIVGQSNTVNAVAATSQVSTVACGGSWVGANPPTADDGAFSGGGLATDYSDGDFSAAVLSREIHRFTLSTGQVPLLRLFTDTKRRYLHPALLRAKQGARFELHEGTLSGGASLAALSGSTLRGLMRVQVPGAELGYSRVGTTQLWLMAIPVQFVGGQ